MRQPLLQTMLISRLFARPHQNSPRPRTHALTPCRIRPLPGRLTDGMRDQYRGIPIEHLRIA